MRLLFFCLGAVVLGQGPAIPPDAVEVLELARAAGPEFFGDTYFRVVGARRTVSLNAEKQLLPEVFERSGDIRVLQPLNYTLPAFGAERARVLVQSQRFQLDRLSLQCLVVSRLLAIQESRKARELFEKIVLPPPSRPGCGEVFVPVRPIYWETLQRVVLQNEAFTAIERDREIPVQMMEDRVRAIESATDLGPAALAIRQVMAQRDPKGRLVSALGGAFAAVQESDRAFILAVARLGAVDNAIALAQEARTRRLPYAGLLTSLRGFLVRHYQGSRCADTIAGPDSTPRAFQASELILPIETFNRRAPSMMTQLDPILDADRRPGAIDNALPVSFPSARLPFSAIAGQVAEMSSKSIERDRFNELAQEVYRALTDWHETSELSGAEFFHQKALVSRAFLELLPADELFKATLTDHLRLLLATPVKRDAPAEWLYHVESLLALTRRPEREDRKAPPTHPGAILIVRALVDNYDPVLHLYGRLEQLFPRPR